MTQLKFIDENDFEKAEFFQLQADGSVITRHGNWNGVLWEGMTRSTSVQDGTTEVSTGFKDTKVGETPVLDDEGNPVLDEEGNPITEPVYESQEQFETVPNMVDVEINVWDKLWELHNDPDNPVTVLPVPIDPVKQEAKENINRLRDSLINGGIDHNGYNFQTDQNSIINMMGAIMTASDVTWLTSDNTPVQMTSVELGLLGQAIASRKEFLVYKAREHKDNIDTLTTKEDIDTYMSTLSWE